MTFDFHIGIDYSGRETPTSRTPALQIYASYAFYPLGRYDVNAPYAKDPARRGEYTHEGRIKMGRIEGRRIR